MGEEIKDPRFKALIEQIVLLRKDVGRVNHNLSNIETKFNQMNQFISKVYSEMGRRDRY